MNKLDRMTADEAVEQILEDPSVHTLTKEIIRRGLDLDCVDAYYDVELAAAVLKKVMQLRLGRGL